jgi:phosphate transport system permease protein
VTNSSPTPSYTGRARRKQTRWSVRAADVVAKWSITIGGIGTIIAVSLVFLFLFSVVIPLFLPARISQPVTRELPGHASTKLAIGLDEFRTTAWWINRDGTLEVVRIDTGELLMKRPLLEGATPTSVATPPGQSEIVVAASDGTLRVGAISFVATFPDAATVPADVMRQLDSSENATWEGGVIERSLQGQLRHQVLRATWSEPIEVAKSPIVLVDEWSLESDSGIGSGEKLVAFVMDNGQGKFCKLGEEQNALTGVSTFTATSFDLPMRQRPVGKPIRILIAGRGDNVYMVWDDGVLQRFDVRDPDQIALVESVQLLDDSSRKVTACGFVLGRETLVCGDSGGGLRAWFRVRQQHVTTGDGQRLTMVHDLTTGPTAVTTIRPSDRGRTIAAGYTDGSMRVFHVTTERRVLRQDFGHQSPVLDVAIAPKDDGLFVLTKNRMWTAAFEPRHPEATFAALFRPVWYEGYDRPLHTWQSSSATSAPEMKLGLLPLVHGTLKATFYAMLFATPLALLAAVYSSEFLHPRLRTVVKPTIEMMASLPSVVLGFLAALVFAGVVAMYVPQLLCTLFCVPFSFLLASFLWQTLPQPWTLRFQSLRVWLLPIPLVLGILLGFAVGPFVEAWLFAGDVMRWLDRQIGNGIGAWLLLLIPLCSVGTAMLLEIVVNPRIRGMAQRGQIVIVNLVKFLAATIFVLTVAYAISWLLNAIGWDPRGSYVSTYVQRNAFVVGIVMGFAVIPIIFTIADDALTSVPQHLRSASMGCGATPWQTAIRVVVPTAVSGLFSAVMIGLGRAVGETMIVLMAGGNTPIMEWNLFDGFRTLSANIAVEMPEAVRDSTHYRTLFLAALTLFIITFILNTVAEMVRLRFRKRAIQL